MRTPSTYTPRQVQDIINTVSVGLPDGRWVPARPEGQDGLRLRHRIKAAWSVFTGKCDVLKWDSQ